MLILVSGARLPRGLHVREHLQGADPDPGAAEGPGHEPPVLAIVYTAAILAGDKYCTLEHSSDTWHIYIVLQSKYCSWNTRRNNFLCFFLLLSLKHWRGPGRV